MEIFLAFEFARNGRVQRLLAVTDLDALKELLLSCNQRGVFIYGVNTWTQLAGAITAMNTATSAGKSLPVPKDQDGDEDVEHFRRAPKSKHDDKDQSMLAVGESEKDTKKSDLRGPGLASSLKHIAADKKHKQQHASPSYVPSNLPSPMSMHPPSYLPSAIAVDLPNPSAHCMCKEQTGCDHKHALPCCPGLTCGPPLSTFVI